MAKHMNDAKVEMFKQALVRGSLHDRVKDTVNDVNELPKDNEIDSTNGNIDNPIDTEVIDDTIKGNIDRMKPNYIPYLLPNNWFSQWYDVKYNWVDIYGHVFPY